MPLLTGLFFNYQLTINNAFIYTIYLLMFLISQLHTNIVNCSLLTVYCFRNPCKILIYKSIPSSISAT